MSVKNDQISNLLSEHIAAGDLPFCVLSAPLKAMK
jgi:hypothetical protein